MFGLILFIISSIGLGSNSEKGTKIRIGYHLLQHGSVIITAYGGYLLEESINKALMITVILLLVIATGKLIPGD